MKGESVMYEKAFNMAFQCLRSYERMAQDADSCLPCIKASHWLSSLLENTGHPITQAAGRC
ncbi:hypothetical protein BWQ95_23405 [Aeromonas hydrophila]|nr:hypothetical protein BWQ95_23405 [Aeromonas hydrophila]